MADDGDDYPLNCIDDAGDFSGWFAISSNKVCNDFCYWNIPSSKNGTTSNNEYASTANPHQSTVLHTPSGTVYWSCIYDSADDKSMLSKVVEYKWIDSWQTYASHNDILKTLNIDSNDVPFPYLRCQKGAGERLETWSGDVVKSATFWESNIIISSLILLGEIAALLFFCKRGRILKYEQVGGTEVTTSADGIIDEDISSFQIDEEVENEDGNVEIDEYVSDPRLFTQQYTHQTTYMRTLRCKYLTIFTSRRAFYIMRILLVIAFNLLLVFTISFAAVSLMEIKASPHFTEGMQKLTPACLDPSLVCPAGNVDIKKESTHWPPLLEKNSIHEVGNETIRESKMDNIMQPFSYIIASDAQLYWFNGEFAEMGERSIPSACFPSDSCGRCTAKHGLITNQRLKRAWESLISGETDGMNTTTVSDLPIPKTLIMNGDLTAYFHPYEKRAYDSIYNDISGLEYYFPSLGNHDIEHMGGAMFGGDEWLGGGPPNCNMEHALGYFRSAFCGQIPSFDTDRIVRYDSSSLAYSWDEGRYHFVHSHYYPSYEMASMKYHSSLEWLESDLQVAHDAGLTTILFVHAVQGLSMAMENIILGKNVKAIIAGHTHRCLHRKCEGIYPLKEDQVKSLYSQGVEKEDELGTTATGIGGENVATTEKCIPAAYDTCQVLNGENLVLARDLASDVTFPTKELKNRERKDKPLCPKPAPFFINETDNSLLCHRVIYSQPNFPFRSVTGETIPIFWSGSSSFETFLKADFYEDRFVINSMTISLENDEVGRYFDLHTVPNAVYPYHSMNDIEETVTHL